MSISPAVRKDLPAILKLQKLCFQSEAAIYGACAVPPLSQTLKSIREEFKAKTFLKMTLEGVLAGSIRAYQTEGVVRLEKLMVHPDFQNHGFGGRLIRAAEGLFPDARAFELMTGKESLKNIHLYTKHGYRAVREEPGTAGAVMVYMQKMKYHPGQPSTTEPDDCGWVCA